MIISKRIRSLAVTCTVITLIAVCIVDIAMTPTAYASSNVIVCRPALEMQEKIKNDSIKAIIEKERRKEMLLQKKKERIRKRREEKRMLQKQRQEKERLKKQMIEELGSYAYMIYEGATSRGLDANLAIAISKLETGYWTSNAFIRQNNFGGLMGSNGLLCFSSLQEGLNAYLNTLEHYRGMSVEQMGRIYCTDGSDWSGKVRSLMY